MVIGSLIRQLEEIEAGGKYERSPSHFGTFKVAYFKSFKIENLNGGNAFFPLPNYVPWILLPKLMFCHSY